MLFKRNLLVFIIYLIYNFICIVVGTTITTTSSTSPTSSTINDNNNLVKNNEINFNDDIVYKQTENYIITRNKLVDNVYFNSNSSLVNNYNNRIIENNLFNYKLNQTNNNININEKQENKYLKILTNNKKINRNEWMTTTTSKSLSKKNQTKFKSSSTTTPQTPITTTSKNNINYYDNKLKIVSYKENDVPLKMLSLISTTQPLPPQHQQHQYQHQTSIINDLSNRDGLWKNSYNRKRRDLYRDELCREECKCYKENGFVTVDCNFTGSLKSEFVISTRRPIPENATLLKIKLGKNTNLRFEEYSFNGRSVNSIIIDGNQDGQENIEIGTNTFHGNRGQFPQIKISNCHTVIFRENSLTNLSREKQSEYILYVTNSTTVHMFKKAFTHTRFHGYFTRIENLRIQGGAFVGASESVININWCKMEKFHPLESALKEIKITNSEINSILSEAFNVIHLTSVIFQDTKIDVIESRVFTEKLYGTYWEFIRCQIGVIRSNAIYKSGVQMILFENNKIEEIEDNAISVSAVNVSFSYNSVNHLGTKWLTVKEWHNVTIFNNTFGLYNLINIERSNNPIQCLFEKNSITQPQLNSMDITNFSCKIKETYFYQTCTCLPEWIDRLSSIDLKKDSYCRLRDVLKMCLNATVYNVHKYLSDICDETTEKLICKDSQSKEITDEHFINPNDLEKKDDDKSLTVIYIIITVSVIFIIFLIILIIFVSRKYWCKKQTLTIPMSEMTQQNTITMMKNSKSFSNDDRLIISRTLEKMKLKQSPEKYDQVYNNTKKLLQGNLTETVKVLTIGEIVKTLGECENSGEDFVAFTDILYKHLAPKNNNNSSNNQQIDPVYAEPNIIQTTVLPPPPPYNYRGDDDGQTLHDHIYAEPHSLQQPLLTNEYASPLDRNEMGGVYSEPILNERDRQLITPYAIVNNSQSPINDNNKNQQQQQLQQQQPSTSKNLPDVLSQSKPMSKVQLIAKNFSNNPNFHINRSPITNRKIPQYTIPNKYQKEQNDNNINPLTSSYFNNNNKLDSDSSNSHSDHSGGSDITCKIDEIEYADA